MSGEETAKELRFVASSRDDLCEFPEEVRHVMGFALYQAQLGGKSDRTMPLKGFGGAGVLEVIEDHDRDTYRTVYTVRFSGVVYVLHAFQKKSRHGRATPKSEIDLVKSRLKLAEADYNKRSEAWK